MVRWDGSGDSIFLDGMDSGIGQTHPNLTLLPSIFFHKILLTILRQTKELKPADKFETEHLKACLTHKKMLMKYK